MVVNDTIYVAESGFTTIKVLVSQADELPKQTFMICSGNNLPTLKGLSLDIYGEMKDDKFYVKAFEVVRPWNIYLTKEYLNYMFGLDIKYCEELTKRFGIRSFDIIDNHPDYLITLHGMTNTVLNTFIERYNGFNTLTHVLALFSPYGISFNECHAISKEFGVGSENILKYNPYLLMKAGISFNKIKEISHAPGGINEASAFILQLINDHCTFSGSSCAPYSMIRKKYNSKYNIDFPAAIKHATDMYGIFNGFGLLYRNDLFTAEKNIAEKIAILLKYKHSVNMEMFSSSMSGLNDEQQLAVKYAVNNRFSIITGGPGTGKSTTMKTVCKIFKALGENITLMAPTAAAADRLSESTGFPAFTIHSTIGLSSESYVPTKSISGRIIIDEASMIDSRLLNAILNALDKNSSITLVGDTEQLSPVNEGFTLADILNIPDIPKVNLTTVYRQKDNTLKDNFKRIVTGNTNLIYNDVFSLHPAASLLDEKNNIIDEYINALNTYDIKDICCIVPFRKKTEISTTSLNLAIREKINPYSPDKLEIGNGRNVLREKDRVLNIVNFENISNGMTGYIGSISEGRVNVIFDNGKTHSYSIKDALERLKLGYTITVHKSQGLEFKYVIIGLTDHWMVSRSMLYTAATRAKDKVVIHGTQKMINKSIKRKSNHVYGGISTIYKALYYQH